MKLPGGAWEVWRQVGLRGTGFAADEVLALAAPGAARAVDAYIEEHGSSPSEADLGATWSEELDGVFERAAAVARDPKFREAIIWQNRPVLHQTLDSFLRKSNGRGWKVRQKLAVIARYLQRYATKNETIGFFGPLGLAHIVDDGPLISMKTGPHLVKTREVYFEQWTLDELARSLEAEFDLRPWMKPRLHCFLHAGEDQLALIPGRDPIPFPAPHLAVLRACDGTRTGREVAAMALELGMMGVEKEEDAFNVLGQMRMLGVITWEMEIPVTDHPERYLRKELEAVDDEAIRTAALERLDELERAKDAVEAAAGDPPALDAAMSELEETFKKLTGLSPNRKAGELSAGRTIVYEDCFRDADVDFGPAFLERLGPALTLSLEAFRWLTWRVSTHYMSQITAMFDELAEKEGEDELPLAILYRTFAQRFLTEDAARNDPAAAEILADYNARWAAIFQAEPGAREVVREASEIEEKVREAFAAPTMGWPAAYLTPNLLVVSESAEAFADGQFRAVLGKMHPGNTLLKAALAALHPDRERLEEALRDDHPEPHLALHPSRELGPRRTSFTSTASQNHWLHFSPDPPIASADKVVRVADLSARRVEGSIQVRSRSGHVQVDMTEVLALWLAEVVHSMSNVLPADDHFPRRVIDDLVLDREQWLYDASDVSFAQAEGLFATFAEARRWALENEIPRFLYVKVDGDPKPVFIDLESPVYVDMAAKMIRKAAKRDEGARVSFREMLPAPGELWLTDEKGHPCTSELLLVSIDGRQRPSDAAS